MIQRRSKGSRVFILRKIHHMMLRGLVLVFWVLMHLMMYDMNDLLRLWFWMGGNENDALRRFFNLLVWWVVCFFLLWLCDMVVRKLLHAHRNDMRALCSLVNNHRFLVPTAHVLRH